MSLRLRIGGRRGNQIPGCAQFATGRAHDLEPPSASVSIDEADAPPGTRCGKVAPFPLSRLCCQDVGPKDGRGTVHRQTRVHYTRRPHRCSPGKAPARRGGKEESRGKLHRQEGDEGVREAITSIDDVRNSRVKRN